MTNNQAIEKLNDIRCHVKETSAEEQALVMAIDALKQPVATDTNVGDTISRKAAIDAAESAYVRNMFPTPLIREVPPVEPGQQWILCEERMPEEHEWLGTKKFGTTISDEVYVTFENEKGERFCQHMSFQNGELSRYDQFHMDTWFKGSKPIAWMPLPEPYKPNK